MKVSIIIVNWNGIEHLKECLDSVREQTYEDFEVILVDNGSTDGSVDYIKRNYGDIILVELDRNSGFAEGNNIGYLYATGEFIVLLNNDTQVEKDWLENLVLTANENSSVGIVQSKMILYSNREILDNFGVRYTIAGCNLEIGRFDKETEYRKSQYVPIACAGSALYKKEMLDKIGFFDEKFFYSYEDIDLSLRAQWAGYKIIAEPKSIVYHKLQATRKKNSALNVYYNQRNNSIVWYKNLTKDMRRKYIIHRWIYNFGCFIQFTKEGNLKPFIKAKRDFLHMRKAIEFDIDHINKTKVLTNEEFEKILESNYLNEKISKLFNK